MRSFIDRHTVLFTLSVAALGFAAGIAVVSYYLSSWLVLPLI